MAVRLEFGNKNWLQADLRDRKTRFCESVLCDDVEQVHGFAVIVTVNRDGEIRSVWECDCGAWMTKELPDRKRLDGF